MRSSFRFRQNTIAGLPGPVDGRVEREFGRGQLLVYDIDNLLEERRQGGYDAESHFAKECLLAHCPERVLLRVLYRYSCIYKVPKYLSSYRVG